MTARQHLPEDQAIPDVFSCSVAEAARLLGVDEQTIRRSIDQGRLMAEAGDGDWIVLLPKRFFDDESAAAAPLGTSRMVVAQGPPEAAPTPARIRWKLVFGLIVLSAVSTGWLVAWFGSTWLARDARTVPRAASSPASVSAAVPRSPTASLAAQAPAVPEPAPSVMPSSAAPAATAEASAAAPAAPAVAAASPAELLQRVAQAEADVRSGWLEAILDYGTSTSTADLRFDVAHADEPRLQIATTYRSGDQVQRVEQIVIGEQVWERHDNQNWQPIAGQEGVWSQVELFLPRARSSAAAEMQSGESGVELRWHNPARDTDVVLWVDPVTGAPHEMRQQARGSDTALRVVYRGWNTPVEITPP